METTLRLLWAGGKRAFKQPGAESLVTEFSKRLTRFGKFKTEGGTPKSGPGTVVWLCDRGPDPVRHGVGDPLPSVAGLTLFDGPIPDVVETGLNVFSRDIVPGDGEGIAPLHLTSWQRRP